MGVKAVLWIAITAIIKNKRQEYLYTVSLSTHKAFFIHTSKNIKEGKRIMEKNFNKKIIMEKEKVYNTIRGFQSLCNLPISTPPSPLAVQQARIQITKYE